MLDYFNKVKPTYIENWPDNLLKHSIPAILIPLSSAEVDALIAFNFMQIEDGKIPTEENIKKIKDIEKTIDEQLKEFPNGAFIRLGSRSPKDSYLAFKMKYQCTSGKDGVKWLCDSERISDDLYLARSNNYTPYIILRPWIKIKPWQEFRCFYKDRELVGISQYNYLKGVTFDKIIKNTDIIEWSLQIKSKEICNLLPSKDVVVDYIVKIKEYGQERTCEVIMLEINPFMTLTDPCLFSWKEGFNQFEFRYNKNKVNVD